MGDARSLPSKLLLFRNNKKDGKDVIRTNLLTILNNHSSLSMDDFIEKGEEKKLDIRHFGLPSLQEISFESDEDRRKLCKAIELAIESFEPRLSDLKISFVQYDKNLKTVKLNVEGAYRSSDDEMNVQVILRLTLWEFVMYE